MSEKVKEIKEVEVGEIELESKADRVARLGRTPRHDHIIRGVGIGVVVASLMVAATNAEGFISIVNNMRTFVTQNFSWWIVLATFLCFAGCVFIAASKYGKIRLGGKDAKPAFSYFSWMAMLFATGQGVGLVFWAVAEPLWMMAGTPFNLQDNAAFQGDVALAWTYFHWALPAWAIYCIVSLFLSYSRYNMKKDNTFRGSVENLFKNRTLGTGVGIVVEVLVVLATIFGLTTSIGCASYQFATGLDVVFGIKTTTIILVGVVVLFAGLATLSVWLGVVKGIKNISNMNAILSILFMLLVFTFGPTLYILGVLPESLGVFIDQFFLMSGYSEAVNLGGGIASFGDSWQAFWSFFIFCWCFAFATFTAGFISTISRGRTLREFVIGVTGVGAAICIIWTVIVGGAGVWGAMSDPSIIDQTIANTSMGLFATIDTIPHIGGLLAIIGIVLIGGYMVTSVDSGVMALSDFVSSAARVSRTIKAALAICVGGLAAAFVLTAGETFLTTIQFATVAGGIPFSIVVVLMAVQFFKWVRHDEQLVELGEAEPFPEDSREHQEYLQWLENTSKDKEATEAAEAVEAE